MVQMDEAICPCTAEDAKVGAGKPTIHIMVVDDEEDIRAVIRALLEAAGYTVTIAQGGPMALKLAQDFPESIDLLPTSECPKWMAPISLSGCERYGLKQRSSLCRLMPGISLPQDKSDENKTLSRNLSPERLLWKIARGSVVAQSKRRRTE